MSRMERLTIKLLDNALEKNFLIRELEPDEREDAYKFRYQVFCNELNWIAQNKSKKDIDSYDNHAVHFGVFSHFGDLVGYSRIILPENNFMLEHEFRDLIENSPIRKSKDTVEISRLAIEKSLRMGYEFQTGMLLYRIMYNWSLDHKVRYWYMAVNLRYLRSLQKLFPCKSIGQAKSYQSGIPTVAALLDLREAEKFLENKAPLFYKWFREKTATSVVVQKSQTT